MKELQSLFDAHLARRETVCTTLTPQVLSQSSPTTRGLVFAQAATSARVRFSFILLSSVFLKTRPDTTTTTAYQLLHMADHAKGTRCVNEIRQGSISEHHVDAHY